MHLPCLIAARLCFDMITNINCLKTSNGQRARRRLAVADVWRSRVIKLLVAGEMSTWCEPQDFERYYGTYTCPYLLPKHCFLVSLNFKAVTCIETKRTVPSYFHPLGMLLILAGSVYSTADKFSYSPESIFAP